MQMLLAVLALSVVLRLPSYDWGACPGECCSYGRWVATQDITAFTQRSEASTAAFHIRTGDHVRALTGVVITRSPGQLRALRDVSVGTAHVQRGEIVSVLHYAGEGATYFWFRGHFFTDELPATAFEEISHGKVEWWVKVKDRRGRVGWTERAETFQNRTSC